MKAETLGHKVQDLSKVQTLRLRGLGFRVKFRVKGSRIRNYGFIRVLGIGNPQIWTSLATNKPPASSKLKRLRGKPRSKTASILK